MASTAFASGDGIIIVSSAEVDPVRCELLLPSRQGGSLRSLDRTRLTQAADLSVALEAISPGLESLAGVNPTQRDTPFGFLLGRDIGTRLGLQAGSELLVSGQRWQAVGELRASWLQERKRSLFVGWDPTAPASECILRVPPSGEQVLVGFVGSWLSPETEAELSKPVVDVDFEQVDRLYEASSDSQRLWLVFASGLVAMLASAYYLARTMQIYRDSGWLITELLEVGAASVVVLSLVHLALALIGCIIASPSTLADLTSERVTLTMMAWSCVVAGLLGGSGVPVALFVSLGQSVYRQD